MVWATVQDHGSRCGVLQWDFAGGVWLKSEHNKVGFTAKGEVGGVVVSKWKITTRRAIIAKLAYQDSCSRQAMTVRCHLGMVGVRNPIRYQGWSDIGDGVFWLNQLGRTLAKNGQCKDKHKPPKLRLSWGEDSEEADWSLVKERLFVNNGKLPPNEDPASSTTEWAMEDTGVMTALGKDSKAVRTLFRLNKPPNNAQHLFCHACIGKSWRISFHSLFCTFHIISFKTNHFTSEIVVVQKPRWRLRGQGGDTPQLAELFLLSHISAGGVCLRPASLMRTGLHPLRMQAP